MRRRSGVKRSLSLLLRDEAERQEDDFARATAADQEKAEHTVKRRKKEEAEFEKAWKRRLEHWNKLGLRHTADCTITLPQPNPSGSQRNRYSPNYTVNLYLQVPQCIGGRFRAMQSPATSSMPSCRSSSGKLSLQLPIHL